MKLCQTILSSYTPIAGKNSMKFQK